MIYGNTSCHFKLNNDIQTRRNYINRVTINFIIYYVVYIYIFFCKHKTKIYKVITFYCIVNQ